MAKQDPRSHYGINSVTPYDRKTGEFFGQLNVLKSSSITMEGTLNELTGGASKFPWAVETGDIKVDMSLKFAEYPDFVYYLFFGTKPTKRTAESSGAVSALTNKLGTSVFSATTGIASLQVKAASKGDLKFTKYVVKVVSPTTVDVYAGSDVDFGRGAAASLQDDTNKITATPLTIVSGDETEIPGIGLEFTGGSGTIAMTVGDTATFEVRPVNSKSMEVVVGSVANQTMPEFGALLVAQKRANGELLEIDCFRCIGSGMPLGFEPNTFSEAEVKVKVFYDSAQDGIFKIRHIES